MVTGTPYSSALGLLLALLIPLWCIFIPLAVVGDVAWILPFGCTLGCMVETPFLRKTSTISITDEGVTLTLTGMTFYVPWRNVDSVKGGTLGASVVLKDAQRLGLFERRRLRFAMLDLFWRTRPTSKEVMRQVRLFNDDGRARPRALD